MAECENPQMEAARSADAASIPLLLSSPQGDVLRALLENPLLGEAHVILLLKRADLPGPLLEEIAKKKTWRGSYRVRFALASHPHVPRLTALRLLRDLHLMDLLRIATLPTTTTELRRLAEERIIAQLPQLPLGQRLMLARRGTGRVAAGVIAEGPDGAAKSALENPFLTEAQLLKALAKETVCAQTIAATAHHKKWSCLPNVQMSIVCHKHAPLESFMVLLSEISLHNIQGLLEFPDLPARTSEFLRQELIRRERKS